jgi:hypothetical protein
LSVEEWWQTTFSEQCLLFEKSKQEGNTAPVGKNWAKGFMSYPTPEMACCLQTCITDILDTGPGEPHTLPLDRNVYYHQESFLSIPCSME